MIYRAASSIVIGCTGAVVAQLALPKLLNGKFFIVALVLTLGTFILKSGLGSTHKWEHEQHSAADE